MFRRGKPSSPSAQDVHLPFLREPICVGIYLLGLAYVLFSYFSTTNGLRDFSGVSLIGRDFVNFWMGGRMVVQGQADWIYDGLRYGERLQTTFNGELPNHRASYPPHALLLLSPLGVLPYLPALGFWTFGGVLAYLAAARTRLKARWHMAALALNPATIVCVLGGQIGLWTGALLVGGASIIRARPILAGLCFGVLTVKPQMGLMLVVALLASRAWTVIAVASVTFLSLTALSYGLIGPVAWSDFLRDVLPFQMELLAESVGLFDHMVPTPYKSIILLGGSRDVASYLQMIFTILAALFVFWTWVKSHISMPLKIAVLCTMTFLASPYMSVYDMPALIAGAVLWADWRRKTGRDGASVQIWILILMLLPVWSVFISDLIAPLGVLAIIGFGLQLLRDVLQFGEQTEISGNKTAEAAR